MTLLRRVVALLDERQVPFALIGAAALAAHGVSRATADIDPLTTDLRTLEVRCALEAHLGARSRVRR